MFWLSDKNLPKSETADPVVRLSRYFADTQELEEKAEEKRMAEALLG